MRSRDFLKMLDAITSNVRMGGKMVERIDLKKVGAMSADDKEKFVQHVVRYGRVPIIAQIIPVWKDDDKRTKEFNSWLQSMGYLYSTKGKEYTFIHTSESKPKPE